MKKILYIFGCCLLLSGCYAGYERNQPPSDLSNRQELQQNVLNNNSDSRVLPELADSEVKTCFNEKDGGKAFLCFENSIKKITLDKGAEEAMKKLKEWYAASPTVQNYCHPLTHSIGHAAIEKYKTLGEANEHGDSFCWSGYYHGAMEEYVEKIGIDKLPAEMPKICENIPGRKSYSFDYYNCVHGLGHGVMAITQDDLFKALEFCDNMEGSWERSSCYGGVFMQNVVNDGLPYHKTWLKPEDPAYPCNASPEKTKETCYLMQTSYMLKVKKYNFSTVFDICSQVEENYRNTCYQSLGRDASGSSISKVEPTRQKCWLGKDENQRSNCIIGAVKDFISYYHSDVQAKELCNSLDNEEIKSLCLKTAEEYYRYF